MQRLLLTGLAVLALFEMTLAAGAPLGHAAWGGDHAHLTTGQRIGSAAAVVFYLGAIAIVRRRHHRGMSVLALLFALSTLVNLASSSPWERFLLAPVAAALALLSLTVRSEARRAALPQP